MSDRLYIRVAFRPGDTRTYTYHWDGEPLKPGTEVKVPDNRSDGWKRVTVVGPASKPTGFDTKAILGIAPPRDDAA